MLIQSEHGQIEEAHSISAGLDYPGIGPEHAFLAASGRAEYVGIGDEDVLVALQTLSQLEGIIPALESAHAVAWIMQEAGKAIPRGSTVLLNLSGRGDKDVAQVLDILRGRE
jgi:tryptophan synthase beta chain